MAAGDIARAGSSGDEQTAALLRPARAVLALGDLAYPAGTLAQFRAFYTPSWGAYRAKTHPVPGNHEWLTRGAAGYEAYFREPDRHWYSFKLGSWHIIALDSTCARSGCRRGSAQYRWLKADLRRNTRRCVLAFWHHPRFSVGAKRPVAREVRPFWELLHAARADVVLNGHDHNYQRWAKLDPAGRRSPRGLRQFIVGTGGASLYPFTRSDARVQRRSAASYGVLRLVLRPGAYEWRFLATRGTFRDSGRTACH
jgi:alkaline phosphatase